MINILDRVGIWTSSLCAIHCVLMPLLLPALPLLGATILAEHWFETAVLIASMIVGCIAVLSGFFRYHRRIYPFYSLILGGFLYWNKDMFGETWEPVGVVVGALFIVLAHGLNLRLCKRCQTCSTQQPQ